MAAEPTPEDWQREAARFRTSPLDALGEALVLGEAELREHLYLLGVPLPGIDRAVARAKGWRDLTPLEQAILDLPLHDGPSGEQIWHALPEALRPTVGKHEGFTMLELELVLRGIERRGMLVRASSVQATPSHELNDGINGWGTVPETLRREVYERIIAGAIENGGAEPHHDLSRALFAILPQGLAGVAGPEHLAPGSEEQRTLVEKAERQLSGFDFSDRTVEQDALLDRLLGPGVETPYGIPRWVVPIAPESSAEQDAHAHLAHMASAPNRGAVIDDQVPMPVMPTERLPVCARCTTPVERMRRLDNIATGDMRIDLTCHGETREVRFTRAELNATGKISTMIYDRLAAAWEPSA